MVSSIDRNWVGGLSSGLDTDSLIKQIIEAESAKKFGFERKRNTIKLKQEMLQDINLKLYNLQTAATDLTFNASFNSKNVSSSNSKLVSATATTGADIGEHIVKVKQIATSTTVSSSGAAAAKIRTDLTLGSQHFAAPITKGRFTLDGVLLDIDPARDSLNAVLARITSNTGLNAAYDAETDKISLRRKDGSTAPIGIGSSADTSSFLSSMGLIGGTTKTAAALSGSDLTQALTGGAELSEDIALSSLGINEGGTLNVIVNNRASEINYNSTDTLKSVLERIKNLSGIEKASFNAETKAITVATAERGSIASLKIEDNSGNLASVLGINGQATGLNSSDTLTAQRGISSINPMAALNQAGLAQTVTAGRFSINGVAFNVANPDKTTLNDIINAINQNEEVGVKAAFNASTGKLELKSAATGNKSIAFGSPEDAAEGAVNSNLLDVLGLTGAAQNVGQNAVYSIDGSNDLVSQSNEISNAVSGVTFKLKDITSGVGETITIDTDTEAAKEKINKFLDLYNEVTNLVYSKLLEKHDNKLQALNDTELHALGKEDLETYQNAFSEGLLKGDATLRNIRSQMRVVMSSYVPGIEGKMNSLADIGITTGAIGSDFRDTMIGTLSITNEKALDDALKNHPDRVAKLFGSEGGIASKLKKALHSFTSADGMLTSISGKTGSSISNEMSRQISELNKQIKEQETRLTHREDKLIQQFASLENAMSKYQAQSAALSNQLSSMM